MMKKILLLFLIVTTSLFTHSQNSEETNLNGIWQGLLVQGGMGWQKSYIIWMELKIDKDGTIKAFTRDETPNTMFYALKEAKGKQKEANSINLSQQYIVKEKSQLSQFWCLSNYELTYDPNTGYLQGPWTSSDCRGTFGKVILYRSKFDLSKGDTLVQAHTWRDDFIEDLSNGLKAPDIRQKELENFNFKPIYFDYDKDSIRDEYKEYLKKMVRVVKSHSDLRIKIIGNTDADGTLEYNDGLSERRAVRIKQFFIDNGLKSDRVVIEYKGELNPKATNDTDEGKQQNRRVDFEFI